MIGIVIIAHGGLAREYLYALEHIVGKCVGVSTISVLPIDDISLKQKQIFEAVETVDKGYGVVLLTDVHGSTPSNLALKACNKLNRKVIYGVNLPMLIKLIKVRKKPLDEVIETALKTGKKYIDSSEH